MKINKNVIIKIVVILLLMLCLVSTVKVYAEGGSVTSFSGNIQNADGAEDSIKKLISTVLDAVRTAGIAVAIIMLVTIATKYIMASAGDRADIKKYAFNYVVGALILFGAAGIATIIKTAVNEAVGEGGEE